MKVVFKNQTIRVVFKQQQWQAWPPWLPWWSYEHNQNSASATWNITHNLWFNPNITVVDTGGNMLIWFWITYINTNSLELSFAWETTWIAYLS